MFASLKRIDAVTNGSNGRQRVVQTDHREAAEIAAARELSVVFAVVRVLDPIRIGARDPEVTYFLPSLPPPFLVEAVAAAGGQVFVGEDPRVWADVTASAGGARPRPVEQIVNEAMSALARRTAAEVGLALDRSGLQSYELDLLPEDDEDEIEIELTDDEGNVIEVDEEEGEEGEEKREADGGEAKWTKIVKLASYAGEVLGQHVNGRWVVSMDHERTFPLMFSCKAGDKEFSINLLGKALKFHEEGMEDSVNFLVSSVIAMVGQG